MTTHGRGLTVGRSKKGLCVFSVQSGESVEMNNCFRAKICLVFSLGGLLSGCAVDGIPLLGLDDSGEFVERFASDRQFAEELRLATAQVRESTFLALRDARHEPTDTLRTVAVGLGFNLSAGLGSVVSIGVSPRVRFIFSNSQVPVVP